MADKGSAPSTATAVCSHPSIWLVVATASLLGGQALATSADISPSLGWLGLLPAALCVPARARRFGLIAVVACLALSVGYWRHRELLHPVFSERHLRSVMSSDSVLYLEGSLRQEPEKLPTRTRWTVGVERVWHPTGAEEIRGDMIVNVRVVRRDWRYGDRLRFRVRPAAPRNSGNPGGFNYAAYLADRGIYATGFLDNDGEVELLERRPNPFGGAIEALRRAIRRYMEQHVSSENSPLLKALTVGDMGEISKQLRSDFTAAGVNHVISISGLHVGMLGLVVFALIRYGCGFSPYLLLRFNLVKIATLGSFIAVVFYTAIAGAMVPTVRSAIMIGVYELAVLLDREEEVLTSLTFAALVIGLVWPGVVSDISFQLSFLAVFFIAWGARQLRAWLPQERKTELPQERSWWQQKVRRLWIHLAVPLLATIGTGPVIAHYFGHLSLAGLVSNPIVVPLVGFVVVPAGLLIGFMSVTIPAAAAPFLWIEERLISLTIWLVAQLAHLPLANIAVPAPDGFEMVLSYGLFLALLTARVFPRAPALAAIFFVLLAGDGIYWWRERFHRDELRITYLNVGQGDAAVVELPGSRVLLVDAGGTASGEFDTGEAIIAPFLRARKILRLDYVIVTHPKIDHYGGMRSIVQEFAPAEFWSARGKGNTSRFDELEAVLDRGGVRRVVLDSETRCRMIDRVNICAIYPAPQDPGESSLVLRFQYGRMTFLFTGDIEKRDERLLQSRAAELRSVVVKVPRHGSAAANSQEFITAVGPKLAIFSGGGRAGSALSRDEVSSRYREAGADILRTEEDGAIILESDGSAVNYFGHKSGKRGRILPLEAPPL